jgi:predicted  nucleic acid-binding Zn-ribbon protein
MTDREKTFAEIREAIEKSHWNVDSIVKAPEWLRFLLDELEQTRKESNMLREELHKFQELAIKAANHHKAERDKLIEALRWYADEENQKLDESTRYWENVYSPYEMDGGQRARDILKEIGVTVE